MSYGDGKFHRCNADEVLAKDRVTALDIVRGWHLGGPLVTLSGCQSALGREAAGEGFVGLVLALPEAGARQLLVSLWKVDDTATSLLMSRFYENLTGTFSDERDGLSSATMPASEALGEARRWLQMHTNPEGQQPFRHPAFWSGFVLIGG